jgi:hypothetical protein
LKCCGSSRGANIFIHECHGYVTSCKRCHASVGNSIVAAISAFQRDFRVGRRGWPALNLRTRTLD